MAAEEPRIVWLFLGTEPEDAQEVIDQQLTPLWPLLSQMLATVRISGVQPRRSPGPGPGPGPAGFAVNEGREAGLPSMQTAAQAQAQAPDPDGCSTAPGDHCRHVLTWWKHTDTTTNAQGVYFGMYTTGDQVGLLAMVQAPPGIKDPPPAYVRASLNSMLQQKDQFHVFRRAASLLKVQLENWRVPLKVRAAIERLVDPSVRELPPNAHIGRVWTVRSGPGSSSAAESGSKRPRSPSPSRHDRDARSRSHDDEDDGPRFISPVRRRLVEPAAAPQPADPPPPLPLSYGVPAQTRYPSPVMRRWNQQVAGY